MSLVGEEDSQEDDHPYDCHQQHYEQEVPGSGTGVVQAHVGSSLHSPDVSFYPCSSLIEHMTDYSPNVSILPPSLL